MSQQCNQFPLISFSQLVQRFRETVSSFDYSQCYQDKDGWFSNKDSGPACLLSQSVVFPKVSKQYSKCFTAANQILRLSKLLLSSVKQDMLPFWRRPTSEDTDNEVMPTWVCVAPQAQGGSCSLPLSVLIIVRTSVALMWRHKDLPPAGTLVVILLMVCKRSVAFKYKEPSGWLQQLHQNGV